ncbi:MAG TPA: chemotaxis protein CheW [Terracidiphilus sp.]|nr:chemotaxis protein CheW [Terracidiphilus sp.]
MSTHGSASHHKDHSASDVVEICSVWLDQSLFGVPISHILEIVGAAHPQPVPLAPGFVGGLVHYRGDVLTTVSLRQLLGLPPREGSQAILVLENPAGDFGLLVDSVGEVLTIPATSYEPNPSTLGESRKDLFAGAYKLKDKLLVLLDPERLDPIRLAEAQAA